jgi:DUF4097 and DUF4098 domain-containing protein YvlB
MKPGKLSLIITLFALVPLSGWAGEPLDQRWTVDARVRVSVENVAGKIEIQGWDRNEVHLTGKLGDSADELEIDVTDSVLQITVVNRNERDIDETLLRLKVPEGANIDASAVSADIEISGLNNEKLTGTSVSGDVEVQAKSQWVSLESVSGDVGFRGQTARVSAESVSGDIELSGISGDVEATTVSGDMALEAGMMDSGKLETVSGDIRISTELSASGRLSAESMSGDVTLSLPASQAGLFRAQSFSGRINTDFGSVTRAKHGPGSHLKYSAGDGGAEIRVESFSGNIKLKRD